MSLRHVGRRETLFEVLELAFTALLIAGKVEEARAVGAELHELARRSETDKLYTALDARAFLACHETRYPDAARIASCAERARAAHGQVRRRPTEERMRSAIRAMLDEHLGPQWENELRDDTLGELAACSLVF